MSWFNNIVTKFFPPKKESQKKRTTKKTPNKEAPLVLSKPSSIKKGKLKFDKIQGLIPLRNLDPEFFDYLAQRFLSYETGDTIFIANDSVEYTYYIVRGAVKLKVKDCKDTYIKAGSLQATFPLNSGPRYSATAIADTPVLILEIASNLTRLWTEKNEDKLHNLEIVDINLPPPFVQDAFFLNFTECYYHNQLKLPTLPGVALKLRAAMKDEIGTHEAVDIIQTDNVITAKLVKVSNSPLYSPLTSINSCHDAITRLGLSATRNLVMSLALKELFHSPNKQLMSLMTQLWKNSLYVSSLSFILAEGTDINPDDALLAGLMCDIGFIPLINFASEYTEAPLPELATLQDSFPHFRAPVGQLLLQSLGFSEELTTIPYYAEDWYYDDGKKEMGLIDIVILAKLHSYFGTPKADSLPVIHKIPAFAKLKHTNLTADLSLDLLHKAKQRVRQIMGEFS